MAHNIAKIDGQDAMFCVGDRKAAWHELGQRTDGAATWQDAMRLAKLDWPVELVDMYARNPITTAVTKIEGYKGVWRAGAQEQRQLGVVGDDYHVIQNAQAFDFVDSLLQAHDGAHYESAGALGLGETIWVLARVPGADIRIEGTDDVSKGYLLVATGHAGNMSYLYKLVSTRVVCQNTLSSALGEAGAMGRIRHTKSAADRLAMAKKVMPAVVMNAQALGKKLNALATRRMTKESMIAVLNKLFPENKETENQGRRNTVLLKVLELFEHNDGDKIPEVRGTAYNLLNAVTEYTDHFRTARVSNANKAAGVTVDMQRATAAMFGTGDALKSQALAVIEEETKDCPVRTVGTPGTWTSHTAQAPQGDTDFLKSLGIKS